MRQTDNTSGFTSNTGQFSRFIIVGFSNFAVSFAVFYLLYNYGRLSGLFYSMLGEAGRRLEDFVLQFGAGSLDAALANIFGYGVGIVNSFIWNRLWTFRVKHAAASQFGRFLVLNLSCLLFSSATLFVFTDWLLWPPIPVWFAAMGVVTLVNFAASKYWVFRVIDD